MAYTGDAKLYREQIANAVSLSAGREVWGGIGVYRQEVADAREKILLNRELEQEVAVTMDARNFGRLRVAEAEEMRHDDLKAINSKDAPDTVRPTPLTGVVVDGGTIRATLKPASWTVIRLTSA
jgi:alpha-L-arabinofuranosidase